MISHADIHDSLSQVKTLLARHQLLETLVHKQNRVELEKVLNQLAPGPMARILEDLSAEERQIIWQLIPDGDRGFCPRGAAFRGSAAY